MDRCYECGVQVPVREHDANGGYCEVHRSWRGDCPARIGMLAPLDCVYEQGHEGNCAFDVDGPDWPADEPRETQGASGLGIGRY